MVHFNVQLNEINSPFYLLIFSGFLLPYVCWHCNTECSSRAVTPSCFVKLRWLSYPKSSSHNDFVRSHFGRFRAHAPNQGVTKRQCKINSNLNFNLFPLRYSTFACISALFWSARCMSRVSSCTSELRGSDDFKGRGSVEMRVIAKASFLRGHKRDDERKPLLYPDRCGIQWPWAIKLKLSLHMIFRLFMLF